MPKEWKRIAAIACITLVAIPGLVTGLLAFDSYQDPFDDRPFDAAAWATSEWEKDRGPMARDAIRHIRGLSASEVRGLLGEPEIVPAGGDRWGMTPRQTVTWSYWLGSWSSLGWYGFDSASLYVHFGPDGRVVAAEITGG